MQPGWEHFDHGADIGVRGIGLSREQAFEMAATALTSVVTDPRLVHPAQSVSVTCAAPDDGLLLADWLNALIYEMATRGMLFSQFEVRLSDGELAGTARGERVDIGRHRPAVEVKGATFTGLRVAYTSEGLWIAECVVDV